MKAPSTNSWYIFVIAIVFGAVAVFAASRYISKTVQAEKDKLNPNVETAEVVVAKRPMDRGDIVTAESMAVRQVPKQYIPGTAVQPQNFSNVEGARLAVAMRGGEILLSGTLEGADASTFSTKIGLGVRAITLTVDEVNSLSGLLQPNDRVDLFYTGKPVRRGVIDTSAPQQTRLLMQNINILATGRQVRPSITNGSTPGTGRAFTTITIQASPQDAQRLILAEKSGHLTAILRGAQDEEPIIAGIMDVGSLFGAPTVRRAATGIPVNTEVIVGGKGKLESEILRIATLNRAQPAQSAPASPPVEAERTSIDNAAAQVLKQLTATPTSADATTLSR